MSKCFYPYIAIFIFGFFDYVFYNLIGRKFTNQYFNIYRVIQFAFQVSLFVLLWKISSPADAYIFFLLWWTFWADMIFYLFNDFLNLVENEEDSFDEILNGKCWWAWWSPVGLYFVIKNKNFKTELSYAVLMVQVVVGFVVSILISMFFKEYLNAILEGIYDTIITIL